MTFKIRSVATLAALAAAVASQAVNITYIGNATGVATSPTSFTTTSLLNTSGAPFNGLGNGLVTLTGGATSTVSFTSGADSLVITFDGTTDNTAPGTQAVASNGTITAGTGVFSTFVSPANVVTINSNTNTQTGSNVFSIQGNVNPVPEPASFAALGLGVVAIMRRRRKSA